MSPRKIPRIALDKARSDAPADRRKAVAVFGDALRAEGACRILVQDDREPTQDALGEVGRDLLRLLEEYFGLETGALASIAASAQADAPEAGTRRLLSLHVVGDTTPVTLDTPEGRQELAARPGEWIAVPGPALEALTGGVVAGAEPPVTGAAGVVALVGTTRAEIGGDPLPEFEEPR